MPRKFYKKVYSIEILSEEPLSDELDLGDIHCLITDGNCSGDITCSDQQEVDGPTMAKLLIEQRSDPGFFGLTSEGKDDEEEEEEEENDDDKGNEN